MAGQRGYRTISLPLKRGEVAPIRTSARTADALEEIVKEATLYDGVRLTQVMEAVYLQGCKDGAREVFERLDREVESVKKAIPHRSVGRPRKRK